MSDAPNCASAIPQDVSCGNFTKRLNPIHSIWQDVERFRLGLLSPCLLTPSIHLRKLYDGPFWGKHMRLCAPKTPTALRDFERAVSEGR